MTTFSAIFAQQQGEIVNKLDTIQQLDEVILKANTILGNKYVARNRTGASYFLSTEDLEKFGYVDNDIKNLNEYVPKELVVGLVDTIEILTTVD